MSRRLHPYLASLMLFLFAFTLVESGLHSLLHNEDHSHTTSAFQAAEYEDHHDCTQHDSENAFSESSEDCKICQAFALHGAVNLADDQPNDLTSYSVFQKSDELSFPKSESKHTPYLRGPPGV